MSVTSPARVLLVISGGIAAYKSLELIRRLGGRDVRCRCILTRAGAQFITPLAVAALSGEKVYDDLFSLTDEAEMGHIRLSREVDLVAVVPATADLMAKMAHGLADDLASTALLATDKPVLIAPAMNPMMWAHPATQANLGTLKARGVAVIGPGSGDMACHEDGTGRLAEVPVLVQAIMAKLAGGPVAQGPLAGRRALVTSGPTHEPIDPVRFIGNRSSGKQGHAIAAALAGLGAEVTLVTGPVAVPDPHGVAAVHVETAAEMLAACTAALPVDIAVCAAAVADWRVEHASPGKIKKKAGAARPTLTLTPNPDILATLSRPDPARPALVVGFAAETDDLLDNAASKRVSKGCDWIVANDVSTGSNTFGGDDTTVHLVTAGGSEAWPRASKRAVAERLAARIADHLADRETTQ